MRALLHYETRAPHQLEAMRALAGGLARHGVHVDLTDNYAGPCDFVAWWGDKAPATMRDRPRLILEAGYINGWSGDYVQDRLRFVSAGWNGLHGRADSGRPDHPPDRWLQIGQELAPWRTGGNVVLVCDQHPGDSVAPSEAKWWLAAAKLCEDTGARLIYRPHPLMALGGLGPLAWSLDDAAVCMTWNSTAAVEAVITGVPTVALDRGSAAWDVTSHAVEEELYVGDRRQWAYNLAYRQWTHDELSDGTAWEVLKHGIENH